jgi:hypothetical protein
LYEKTELEQVKTLAGIEAAVRGHLLEPVSPEVEIFIAISSGTTSGRKCSLDSVLGRLQVSKIQAQILEVKANSRWSPYLEQCCLLVSANESCERAAEDIEVLTGMKVCHSNQKRLVHRQIFELPQVPGTVEKMSVDGGKVRLRTPQVQPGEWRDYRGVNLHDHCVAAFFQDNEHLVNWVNTQPYADPLTCLGDGHDGIWNLYTQIGTTTQRREILDWSHFIENLGKIGGSEQRLTAVETCL